MRWAIGTLCCVVLVTSCLSGSDDENDNGGNSMRNDSPEAAAQQLTIKMEIPNSQAREGAIPDPTAGTVSLMPSTGTVMLAPGAPASILALDVDNPDEDSNPVGATLLQFEGDDDNHIHADGSVADGTLETMYSVTDDACDGLCAKVYTFTMYQAVELEDESVSETIERTIELDCRDDGDPDLCGDGGGGAGGSGGSGGSGGGGSGVDPNSLAGMLENSLNALTRELCDCEGGTCTSEDVIGVDTACAAGVFSDHETDEEDYLSCVNDAVQAHAGCVAASGCGTSAIDTCASDYMMAEDDCGTASSTLQDDLMECMSGGGSGGSGGSSAACAPDQFQCDDARCIPTTWVCDDADDCSNGEDEADC
jgi:hypothetical protein